MEVVEFAGDMGTALTAEFVEQGEERLGNGIPTSISFEELFPDFDLNGLLKEYGPRIQSPRLKRMVQAYCTSARWNLSAAAREAGYRHPEKLGSQQKRLYPKVFEAVEDMLRQSQVMGAREWDCRVTKLARDDSHRDHYKALELWGKVIGRVNDKIVIDQDRTSLTSRLTELVSVLLAAKAKQLGVSASVELTPQQDLQLLAQSTESDHNR